MKELNIKNESAGVWPGLILALFIGLAGYGITIVVDSPLLDPLLIAMILGIVFRTVLGTRGQYRSGISFATVFFIPVGIFFYAANNLNFAKFAKVETTMSVLMIVVVLVYFIVILLTGRLLKQRKQITFLTATGSAICGASAIAITSPAVDAEPDDTAIALISVALAALVSFSIVLPFLATLFDITGRTYSLLSGSVLQFTGLVKVAVNNLPFLRTNMSELQLMELALSVKSVRFLGLLIAIPLFGSFVKKKFHIPWVLWVFLIAGLGGTYMYVAHAKFYGVVIPKIKLIHDLSWSIAMAAIGLNADVRQLLSNDGIKSLVMAFAGTFIATVVFFAGLSIIESM